MNELEKENERLKAQVEILLKVLENLHTRQYPWEMPTPIISTIPTTPKPIDLEPLKRQPYPWEYVPKRYDMDYLGREPEMLERWYRKLMAQGELKAPAIVVADKNSPRGLTKEEIRAGLDASKEKAEPAFVNWEFNGHKI